MMEDMNKIAVTNFYEALVDPDYGHSYDSRRTAFGHGVRHEMPDATLFDWLQRHVRPLDLELSRFPHSEYDSLHPERYARAFPYCAGRPRSLTARVERFHRGMIGMATVTDCQAVVERELR